MKTEGALKRAQDSMILAQGFVIGVLGFNLLQILSTKVYGVDPLQWQGFVSNSLLGAVAGLIVGFLIFSAYGVVSTSLGDLLDRTLDESLQLIIVRALARHFDEYAGFHGLRSRRSGRDVYIEIFLEFDGTRPMSDVQRSIDAMASTIEQDIPGSHAVICPTTRPPR